MATMHTPPSSKKKLILKHGERKMLMHRLSNYEDTITLARLELHLSPIKQYLLMVDMADIEPGSPHGLVELSRMAWDLVSDCQGTPVLEIREDPGYDGEPQGEEVALRWREFRESKATLDRELGLPSPAPPSTTFSASPKKSKAAPKDTKTPAKDTKSAAKDVPKDALPALKDASPSMKDSPLARKDGKIEIAVCRGDSSEVAKFLVKPSSSVEKVLKGWFNMGENRSKIWRMEFKGKSIPSFDDQTMADLGAKCGDKIYAWEQTPDAKDSILFHINWSSVSANTGSLGFKVRKSARFQTVIDAWCDAKGHREEDWIFEIDGEELIWSDDSHDTIEDLGIENGDEILAIRDT